jgi:hypothetical protein
MPETLYVIMIMGLKKMDKINIVPGATNASKTIEITQPQGAFIEIKPWNLLGITQEDFGRYKLAESAFDFWNNEDDARFDNL